MVSYAVDVTRGALARMDGSVRLPEAVQFACPDGGGQHLYVVSSNGAPGAAGTHHYASALRIDRESRRLYPHGEPIRLPSRPLHITTDRTSEHALIVYNGLDTVTVLRIARDGSLGEEVRQPASLHTGHFSHEIAVTPSNEAAIVVARGTNATAVEPEPPGALNVLRYTQGVLENRTSIAPNGGYGFGPRNIALNPRGPWLYASLERQNQLCVFPFEGDAVGSEPLFQSDTLADVENVRPMQLAGAIHMHPTGRFLYLANRAFGAMDVDGRKLFCGGENTIVVYAIDDRTGEPTKIQTVDTHGIYARTFSIDPSGRMLVAANIRSLVVRRGAAVQEVPANLSVFSIGEDGRLEHVRSYDLDFAPDEPFWSGLVAYSEYGSQ
ncbi:MAG: beta-propeller fold lactonase family protein [Gemmatimonadota bacterium]